MIGVEESDLTKGFIMVRDRIRVSLLQFVDDAFFFFKASLEYLQNLKLILLVFGRLLGFKINLERSTLSSINIS